METKIEKELLNINNDNYESIEDQIKLQLENGLINENLEPIKCKCSSTEFYDKTIDKINYLVVEFNRYCKNCDKLVGYWGYGSWIP